MPASTSGVQASEDPEFYLSRGLQYGRTGNTVDAIRDFDRGIQLRPDYADAYFNRGIAHRDKGDLKAACADFRTASSLNFEAATKAYQEFCR